MAEGQATPAAAPAPAPAPAPVSRDMRGVPEPVQRIEAILNAEKAGDAAPPQAQAEPPQLGDPAPQEGEQPEEGAADNRQLEGQEPQEEPKGEEGDGQTIPLDQLEATELEVTIKGEDGKDVTEKLPVKELKLGYMRQKDYQRKTAEVARQREAVPQEIAKQVGQQREQYVQSLQQLQAAFVDYVAPELKSVDWNTLANNDAFEYVRLRNKADQVSQVLSQLQSKQQEAVAKNEAERKALMTSAAQKSREILESDIPGWNDELYQTLMKSGESVGYKPEEVATWVDARAIKLLHKAHLYDQLQAKEKAPATAKKVVVAPKVVKPGTNNTPSAKAQQEMSAMKRLQASGKLDDAAAVIRSRLG